MSNGLIFYRGPSRLDGAAILGILTGFKEPSKNEKTGDMLQAWILRADMSPVNAAKRGLDYCVCGNCKHRPVNDNTCYVKIFQAPRSIWEASRAGAHADLASITGILDYSDPYNLSVLGLLVAGENRPVRIGAYGDPAALPFDIVSALAESAPGHTGYTHQWHAFPEMRRYVMASVDSLAEMTQAVAMGFRTFRTGAGADIPVAGEIGCPASEEMGYRTNCFSCKLCKGAENDRVLEHVANVRINPHGSNAVAFYRSKASVAA